MARRRWVFDRDLCEICCSAKDFPAGPFVENIFGLNEGVVVSLVGCIGDGDERRGVLC